jgi:preprotein translocase subunit SecB
LSAQDRRVSHTADRTKISFAGEFIVSTTNGGSAQAPAADSASPPQLMVLGQYIKDLSFENPNAPASLQPQTTQPQINVNVNVTANPMTDTDIEVVLRLEGKAELNGTVMFNIELEFAGVFRFQNVPQEQVQPLVLIECPRLLFPFAREIVATSVRNGGFPPLMLDPIDFVALYQQRLAQQTPQQPVA